MADDTSNTGLNALLAQLTPRVGNGRASAELVADVLHAHSSEIAVFPELFLGGYSLRHAAENAITSTSPEIDLIRSAAAATSTAVVVGFVESTNRGLANSAACIDADGTLVGIYRKMQLFGHERDVFNRGDSLLVANLVGRDVGVQICFDTEFPEIARALARAGAEILVTVSANMAPYSRTTNSRRALVRSTIESHTCMRTLSERQENSSSLVGAARSRRTERL